MQIIIKNMMDYNKNIFKWIILLKNKFEGGFKCNFN